jgi:hypothetical protein
MCNSLSADLRLVNLDPSLHATVVMVLKTETLFLWMSFYNKNRAILCSKLENDVLTIELILAGDDNLTPEQNIDIFSAVYFIIRRTQHFN